MSFYNCVQQPSLSAYGGSMMMGMGAYGAPAAYSQYGAYGGAQRPAMDGAGLPSGSGTAMSQILPNLFLGSYDDAMNVQELSRQGITKVLNVANDCPVPMAAYQQAGIQHLQLRIDDGDVNIHPFLAQALPYLQQAISNNEKVLVHCRMGRSRSAMIVIAYLMKNGANGTSAMGYEEAEKFVLARRWEINPNAGFERQLRAMDSRFVQQQPLATQPQCMNYPGTFIPSPMGSVNSRTSGVSSYAPSPYGSFRRPSFTGFAY